MQVPCHSNSNIICGIHGFWDLPSTLLVGVTVTRWLVLKPCTKVQYQQGSAPDRGIDFRRHDDDGTISATIVILSFMSNISRCNLQQHGALHLGIMQRT